MRQSPRWRSRWWRHLSMSDNIWSSRGENVAVLGETVLDCDRFDLLSILPTGCFINCNIPKSGHTICTNLSISVFPIRCSLFVELLVFVWRCFFSSSHVHLAGELLVLPFRRETHQFIANYNAPLINFDHRFTEWNEWVGSPASLRMAPGREHSQCHQVTNSNLLLFKGDKPFWLKQIC